MAVVQHTAMVPGSNDQIERREAHVWTLSDGKIVSLREFATRDQAVKAARLQE